MAMRLNTRCRGNTCSADNPFWTRGLRAAASSNEAPIRSTKSVNTQVTD